MELRKKGRHALWAPEPYLQLPLQYRRGGTQIGDVGIITQDGDFDFMFNIYGRFIPANNDLADFPIGFAPIRPPRRREKEVSAKAEHQARDTLTSQGMSKRILYVSSEHLPHFNDEICTLGPMANLSSPVISQVEQYSSCRTDL